MRRVYSSNNPKICCRNRKRCSRQIDAATVMSPFVAEPEIHTRQVAAPRHATISRSHTYVRHAVIEDISSGCWVSPTLLSPAHWTCPTQRLHLKRLTYGYSLINVFHKCKNGGQKRLRGFGIFVGTP